MFPHRSYSDQSHVCPVSQHIHNDTGLEFSIMLGDRARTCEGTIMRLLCCMTGFTSITWEFHYQGHWIDYFQEYLTIINSDKFERFDKEDGQVLVVEKSRGSFDNGTYRCTGRSAGESRSLDIVADVVPCNNWKKPPYVLSPVKKLFRRLPGESLEVLCEGFYGNEHDKTFWTIDWRFNGVLVEDNKTTVVEKENGMAITLKINSVSREDYGMYSCYMKTKDENRKTVVKIMLEEGSDMVIISEWKEAAISIVILVIMVVLLVIVVWIFHLEIVLFYRDRFRRTTNSEKAYDALILYPEGDAISRKFVLHTLHPKLTKEFNYRLWLSDEDMLPGASILNAYENAIQESQSVLLVLSPAFLKQRECEHILNETILESRRNMIFLILEQIPSSSWMEDQRNIQKAVRVGRKVKWPKSSSSSINSISSGGWAERRFWTKLHYYLSEKGKIAPSLRMKSVSEYNENAEDELLDSSEVDVCV